MVTDTRAAMTSSRPVAGVFAPGERVDMLFDDGNYYSGNIDEVL